jgi:ABC-2 type transport system ATP-binding protein
MCDHIVLINRGRNVLQGDVQAIKNQYKQNLFRIEADGELPPDFESAFTIVGRENGGVTVQVADDNLSNEPLAYLMSRGLRVRSFREILPTFNEIFIRRVQETLA